MYRVAILTNKGTIGKNFDTREKADEWLLSMLDKVNVKRFIVRNLDTGETVEDEKGRRDKKSCWEE